MKTRRLGFLGLVGALALTATALSSACAGTDTSGSAPGIARTQQALSTGLVISQVYPGGGSSSATYKYDYIEIFNRGTTPVSLTGKSLQYASATGPSTGSWNVFALTSDGGTLPDLQPGQYFLVETGTAGSVTATPTSTPDLKGGTLSLGGTAGKVALVDGVTPLTCGALVDGGVATPCTDPSIIDLVGYGTASAYEGSGPVAATSTTTAAIRKLAGCMETDNNLADFDVATPDLRNNSSPTHLCSGVVDAGPSDGMPDTSVELPDVAADAALDAVLGGDTGAATDSATTADAAGDSATTTDAATDTGTTTTDTGTTTTDTGTTTTDTGTTTTDAADTGAATDAADTGAAADTATTEDTGTVEEDTGTVDFDTGTTPADTGSATADTGPSVAPAEGTTEDSGCGCRTPAKNASNDGIALAALAVGLAVAVRRKR